MVSEECLQHMEVANEAYNSSNLLKALKEYNLAIDCDASFDEAWYNKGLTLQGMGRNEEALKCYKKTTELNPKNVASWNNMGMLLVDMDRPKEAMKCFDRLENCFENP